MPFRLEPRCCTWYANLWAHLRVKSPDALIVAWAVALGCFNQLNSKRAGLDVGLSPCSSQYTIGDQKTKIHRLRGARIGTRNCKVDSYSLVDVGYILAGRVTIFYA